MKPKEQYKKFMEILFGNDIGMASMVCHGKEPYHTLATEKPFFGFDAVFTSINLLSNTRKDSNVSVFRNFLVELDKGDIKSQMELINNLKMPFSTCVFSGNKSLHFIISLETPLKNKEEYDNIAHKLYQCIPNIDKANKNCSRFTRTAGAYRDGDKEQTMFIANSRVNNEVFLKWLSGFKTTERILNDCGNIEFLVDLKSFRGRLKKSTVNIFMNPNPLPEGERNSTLYKIACDFKNNNYPKEEVLSIYKITKTFSGLSYREFEATVNSAYERAELKPRL